MAVNTEYKRFSMLRFGSPWAAAALLFVPDAGITGPDRAAVLHLYGGNGPYDEATPPLASNDSATATTAIPEIITVLANDAAPPPEELDPLTVATWLTQPANGAAVANPDGTVTYTSDPGFTGLDTFTYQVANTDFIASNVATVAVTVTAPFALTAGFGFVAGANRPHYVADGARPHYVADSNRLHWKS